LTVQFTDRSEAGSHAITSWQWNFGDGGTSTIQNPSHTYSSQGVRNVSLTVGSEAGSDSGTKADYISVVAGGTPDVAGTVVDVDSGLGLGGTLVELFNADTGASLGSTTASGDGSFSVAAPNRTTELRIRFSRGGYDSKELAGLTAPVALNVQLENSVPRAPTGLAGRAGAQGVSLSWSGNTETDLAGYHAYRDTTDKAVTRVSTDLVVGTEYVDTSAERGEEYRYYVTAVDDDGNESDPSNEITVLHGVIIAWLPNVSGQPGDQLRVPISVENASGVEARGIDIWLKYDADMVDFGVAEPVRVERTAVTSHVEFESDVSEPGSVDISTRVENDALVGEGQIFNVFFILKSALAPGACGALEFGKVTLYDAQSMPIAVDFSDTGLLCAKSQCRQGDLNDDGVVNGDDVSVALRISVGLDPARGCQPFAGDLNGDRIIDSADALLIQRLADGLPLNPPQPGEKALHLCENALKSVLAGKQATALSIGVASGDPGQTVSVPVVLSNATGLTGYGLVVGFPNDNALVALQSVSAGTLTSGFEQEIHPGPGFVELSMSAPRAVTANQGAIAVLTFKVAETAPPGTAFPVVVSEAELDGQYGDRFDWYTTVTKQNGAIYVGESPAERSDVDGNGTVNAVDVQLVINEALDLFTGYDCDINEDGDVNAIDVQLVINAALGLV
jgi:PKD repeat protein